jgi:hypothetical protein
MAIHKPTRSPRRAQLHSTSARARRRRSMKHPAGRLPVYETLFALNRDFEQVLAHFARLQEVGVFQHPDLASTFHVFVQEMRAWANMEMIETLRPLEKDDWTHFSRLHNETLNKAKRFLAKKRRKAAGKKRQRKQSRAKSEGV